MAIYLDNSATSHPKPPQVYEAVLNALKDIGANPGRGGYKLSLQASRIVFDCREELAGFFNAEKSDRIVFTSNATEAINTGIKGLLKPGDEVITSPLEHNSVLRPLHALEKKSAITLKFIECGTDGSFGADNVRRLITPSTRLIALTHASNVIGIINPVEEVFALCKKTGVHTLLDCAQTAGIIPIDVRKMNIDMLAGSGHKALFGPQGTGFLYVKEGLELSPLKEGGTGTQSSSVEHPAQMPESLETGTLNTPGIAGLAAGLRFIKDTGIHEIREHELALSRRMTAGLKSIQNIILYGPQEPEKRASALSFNFSRLDCSEAGFIFDEIYDIYVRVGLHCAPLVHKLIGSFPQGTIRVSPGYFNTEGEIDVFINAVNDISKKI